MVSGVRVNNPFVGACSGDDPQDWPEDEAREPHGGVPNPPVTASLCRRLEHPLVLDAPVEGVDDAEQTEGGEEPQRRRAYCRGRASSSAETTARVLAVTTWYAGVSFARTPLEEVSAKVEAIKALGWHEERRGDPWVGTFSKAMPEDETDPEAELRAAMGDHWLDADAIQTLLASKSE